jgi:demethylmenaquinone methyltransferase/2-methoxy-6-polyprenyl-1,4-benzoquinol methylase
MTDEPILNFAGWYDSIFEGVLGGLRAAAARIVPPQEGMKVLDIGCGTGSQLAFYDKPGCQVYGIDLSQPMLRVARSKLGERAGLSIGDALQIPHQERTFNLVISSLFIHQLHPDQRTAMLEEAVRVLKPEGQILLVDFHVQDSRSIIGKLTYAVISMIEFFAGWEHFSNSRDFLAKGGIPPIAGNLGLRVRKEFVVGNGNLGVYLLNKID